jgi:hypothetical protein
VGRVDTKMSFSVWANFDITAKISFSVKNFAKSVQGFSFSLKSPTSKFFCENNYNFAYTANFSFLTHIFAKYFAETSIFCENVPNLMSLNISQNCSFDLRDVGKFCFFINIRKSQHLEVFVIFSYMLASNFRENA